MRILCLKAEGSTPNLKTTSLRFCLHCPIIDSSFSSFLYFWKILVAYFLVFIQAQVHNGPPWNFQAPPSREMLRLQFQRHVLRKFHDGESFHITFMFKSMTYAGLNQCRNTRWFFLVSRHGPAVKFSHRFPRRRPFPKAEVSSLVSEASSATPAPAIA